MYRPSLRTAGGALVALAVVAGCSHSNSSPSAVATATPTATVTTGPSSTPVPAVNGAVYVPDGGGGNAGIEAIQFEDTSGNLLAAPKATFVRFPDSVGTLAYGVADLSGNVPAAASMSNALGAPYPLVVGVSGLGNASPVVLSGPLDLSVIPTPAPSTTPGPQFAISDVSGLAIVGSGTLGIPVAVGGSGGFIAATSLAYAPLQYGNAVAFSTSAPAVARNSIAISTQQSNGSYTVLARGADLLAYSITLVTSGYQFNYGSENATLGTTASLVRGRGAMAISPADDTRAVVGQAGGANVLALVTGLPSTITVTSTLALPSAIHSVAITSSGLYAVVGTDTGIDVVGGVSSGVLALVDTIAPSYVAGDGLTHQLANVSSVALTLDQRYIAALALLSTAGGTNSSVVAVPFAVATPTPSPTPVAGATAAPTSPPSAVVNNVTSGSIDVDNLVAR